MAPLTTDLVSSACRIFLSLAYPSEDLIPTPRRLYLSLPPGKLLVDLHTETPFPPSTFQVISGKEEMIDGFAIRLGSYDFPHLKLKILRRQEAENEVWVFSVDTHDHFRPPPDHPDSEAWKQLQIANSQLKEKIERAWEAEGFLTFNAILRENLPKEE